MRVFPGGGGAAQGNSYVDRGDPASADFAVGDLTTNANWHDLDLSSIVPAGAVAVHLRCVLQDDAVGTFVKFRENGNSNELNVMRLITQVANNSIESDFFIRLDSNRVIEYNASNLAIAVLSITVRGYLI